MPKIKTHRGAAKRFRKTASGKYKAGHANRSHILTKKPTKRKRNLRQTNHVRAEDAGRLDRLLPYLSAGLNNGTSPTCSDGAPSAQEGSQAGQGLLPRAAPGRPRRHTGGPGRPDRRHARPSADGAHFPFPSGHPHTKAAT